MKKKTYLLVLPALAWPAVMRAAAEWSVLAMAHGFNRRLPDKMHDWLPQIPILSVDCADSMDFNDRAIEITNAYNRSSL
ncbi:MAG: hypothetical protein FWE98_06250 [Oscillospiraceae bacterium]|nr:hypothetical protein [Oscillospiraceae bacterium]